MTTNEFKKLIASKSIRKIVFFQPTVLIDGQSVKQDYWEIWAYDHENECTIKSFGCCLSNSSRDEQHKTYTSLDRALIAIRKLGYYGLIEIDC